MEHFVTLFDSLFLPQGLALHMSMERHVKDYTLWILCVDDCVYNSLNKLQLPNVRLLQLSKLETAELLRVKPMRSKGEYCWTLTPFAPRFVFEADPLAMRVTYLDADMWFLKGPTLIFQEFESSRKAVLITEHAYAPEYDQSYRYGKFCVQFMIFYRDASECVRKWWEERCIEWCFSMDSDGKFGDQKYLDDWPERFSDTVHVLRQRELLLAPWNATMFSCSSAALYHFHGLRIGKKIYLNDTYSLPKVLVEYVYKNYVCDIENVFEILNRFQIVVQYQSSGYSLLENIVYFLRCVRRVLSVGFHLRSLTANLKCR